MRIITDSAADLTHAELAERGVHCVSTQVIYEDQSSMPSMEVSAEEFWRRLLAGERVKTSQPAPGAFLEEFSAAKAAGDEVVCICVSSGVSGTIQSARLAAAMCDWEGIHIVDSLTGAAAQKLLVLHACKLRDEARLAAAQVAAELEKLRGRVRLLASVETLEYMARSGRVPKVVASLGTLTQLKPLLEVNSEGRIVLGGKAFGRHRAMEGMIRRIAGTRIDSAHPVIPLYSYRETNCRALMRKLKELNVAVADACCAIGTSIAPHIGPDAYGVAFVEAE